MIIHTIMPLELIYPIESAEYGSVILKSYGDILLHVKCDEGDRSLYEIVRIESTNPMDYLEFQPGQKIRM